MGVDAVAVLRVKSRKLLRERLERAQLPASCIEPLDDGSALFSSMARFAKDGPNEYELRVLLTCLFGDDLAKIHDDPRGVLVFPDACEPRGRTYDSLVTEVAEAGVWLPTTPLSDGALRTHAETQMDAVKQMLAGAADPPRAPLPTGEPVSFETAAKQLGLGSFDELVSQITARIEKVNLSVGCLLVQRDAGDRIAPGAFPDAEEVYRLGDGTLVVVTASLFSAIEMIALALGERWAPWLTEHGDPRGVLVFPEPLLDAMRAKDDYASAVEQAGARGSWVKPTTMDDWLAARAARSAAYLAED